MSSCSGSTKPQREKSLGYTRKRRHCQLVMSPQIVAKEVSSLSNKDSDMRLSSPANKKMSSMVSTPSPMVTSSKLKRKVRCSRSGRKIRRNLQLKSINENLDQDLTKEDSPNLYDHNKPISSLKSLEFCISPIMGPKTQSCINSVNLSEETTSEQKLKTSIAFSDSFFDAADLDDTISNESIFASLDDIEKNYICSNPDLDKSRTTNVNKVVTMNVDSVGIISNIAEKSENNSLAIISNDTIENDNVFASLDNIERDCQVFKSYSGKNEETDTNMSVTKKLHSIAKMHSNTGCEVRHLGQESKPNHSFDINTNFTLEDDFEKEYISCGFGDKNGQDNVNGASTYMMGSVARLDASLGNSSHHNDEKGKSSKINTEDDARSLEHGNKPSDTIGTNSVFVSHDNFGKDSGLGLKNKQDVVDTNFFKTAGSVTKVDSTLENNNNSNNSNWKSESPKNSILKVTSPILRKSGHYSILKLDSTHNGTILGDTFTSLVDIFDDISENLLSPGMKDRTTINLVVNNSFYGLPMHVKSVLKSARGIESLYEWQDKCLKLRAVERQENLIYSLPTSGGKTLVAEILIMRELLCHHRDVLLILPYVSIVQEKVRALSPFAVELGFHVEEYAASRGSIPPKKRRKRKSVYIATIEKANALVNSLIDTERTNDLGLVVVDEFHMIGEGSGRGATLEMCLTKLKYVSEKLQIVGMSATLGNIEDLQEFLKAEVFKSDFRPVQLKEFVKLEDSLYEVNTSSLKYDDGDFNKLGFVRKIKHPGYLDKSLWSTDNDHLLALVTEVIPDHSCLVFCPTKANCQNVALLLAKTSPVSLKGNKKDEKLSLLKEIKNNVNAVCPTLAKTIPYGIAYHHSGLTMDERKLIEEAYSAGVLCLLCCTSTLAAGVNLPAKRVILRAPYVAGQFLSRSRYKQMVGRAGRAGIDSSGESIVIIQQKDKKRILELIGGPSEQCVSSLLYEEAKGLRSLILTLIGLKICKVIDDVVEFMKGTLYYVQNRNNSEFDLKADISNAVTCLRNLGLLEVKQKGAEYDLFLEATELGMAAFKGCLDVDRVPTVYKELRRGIEKLVLVNDLHLLYLCTPLDNVLEVKLNWHVYYRQMSRLKKDEIHVAEIIGVPEGFIARKACGQRCGKHEVDELVLHRFYHTLMLYQLMNETSVWQTASNFSMPRGFLQNLLNSTTSFASLLTHFTEELKEFWSLKLLIEAMIKKLTYTSSLELVPLMEVPGVKQARAKQLYKAGYHSLASLAWADPENLMKQIENLPRRQAKLIVSSAKMLLQEKAEALREEAEEMIAGPLNFELKVEPNHL